jgi:hypothetical protein
MIGVIWIRLTKLALMKNYQYTEQQQYIKSQSLLYGIELGEMCLWQKLEKTPYSMREKKGTLLTI